MHRLSESIVVDYAPTDLHKLNGALFIASVFNQKVWVVLPVPLNVDGLANLHADECRWLSDARTFQSIQATLEPHLFLLGLLIELHLGVSKHVAIVALLLLLPLVLGLLFFALLLLKSLTASFKTKLPLFERLLA